MVMRRVRGEHKRVVHAGRDRVYGGLERRYRLFERAGSVLASAVPQADLYSELRFGVNPSASVPGGTYDGTITVLGN